MKGLSNLRSTTIRVHGTQKGKNPALESNMKPQPSARMPVFGMGQEEGRQANSRKQKVMNTHCRRVNTKSKTWVL